MFTGLIQQVGTVVQCENDETHSILSVVLSEPISSIRLGDSISVSGVCLTVSKREDHTIHFSVMPETFAKTTLGNFVKNQRVNIECALRVGDALGGHFVYGHVDGVGDVVDVKDVQDDKNVRVIVIKLPLELTAYILPRGSVAVDGVSLTIAQCETDTVTVSLVAHTLAHTTLHDVQIGDRVNVEMDMLMKMVSQTIKSCS